MQFLGIVDGLRKLAYRTSLHRAFSAAQLTATAALGWQGDRDLPAAMLLQTIAFVAFNKVGDCRWAVKGGTMAGTGYQLESFRSQICQQGFWSTFETRLPQHTQPTSSAGVHRPVLCVVLSSSAAGASTARAISCQGRGLLNWALFSFRSVYCTLLFPVFVLYGFSRAILCSASLDLSWGRGSWPRRTG